MTEYKTIIYDTAWATDAEGRLLTDEERAPLDALHKQQLERAMREVYHGLCQGGPLNGKTHAQQDSRVYAPKGDAGKYVHMAAVRTTPATWRWIENRKEPK